MKSYAYYNEIDPYAAQWLRNLIAAGHIANGYVDERSIVDVRPSDLVGFTQCHFFAGIGVWSYALRRAGWPDDRPVWTGSCPCQPFSDAGAGGGFADERHLWPHWHHLIRVCRPAQLFGEQVASKDGLGWLDLVQADLEGTGYACWPVDLCAAGIGAPHRRQRLWFVGQIELAHHADERRDWRGLGIAGVGDGSIKFERPRAPVRLDDSNDAGSQGHAWYGPGSGGRALAPGSATSASLSCELAAASDTRPGPTNGIWGDADWLLCRDGKWRPVEPGTFPLAHGAFSRVGRLRAYGNAIVAQAAEAVIGSFLDHERSLAADRSAMLIGHNGGPSLDEVLG